MTLLNGDLFEDKSGDEASRVYHLVNKMLLSYVRSLL